MDSAALLVRIVGAYDGLLVKQKKNSMCNILLCMATDLQSKELGVQVICALQNVHHLEPHIWIVLQVPQYQVCSSPLCYQHVKRYS